MANKILSLCVLAIICTLATAEPGPLQDFCVADPNSGARVNGQACLDAKQVQASHFSFSGLHLAAKISNAQGSTVTPVTVAQIPGLNTLGISLARIDFAPYGVVQPHIHPRASEVLTVLEGSILVGFVTSNPENKLFTKTLKKGDVFVFPVGLVHFQQNLGSMPAASLSGLGSQNPGVSTIGNTVFGSTPDISDDILSKAFQVNKAVIDQLKANF